MGRGFNHNTIHLFEKDLLKKILLFSFERSCSRSGDISEVVTPVPIPNTEVKHFSGEDSYACRSEKSSLPGNLRIILIDYPFFSVPGMASI